MNSTLRFHRCSPKAYPPSRATCGSAGYDLFSPETYTIPPGGLVLVDTGLCFHLPSGTYGRIADRSSVVLHHRLHVVGGVIDSDYRGVVKVMLHNFGSKSVIIDSGFKIAQMIVTKVEECTLEETKELDLTIRGAHGFGSSGSS